MGAVTRVSAQRLSAVAAGLGRRKWTRLILIALVLLGGALRLYNLNWDDYQHAHPDERHITWVATSITWPADPSTLFDPLRTTLNPFRWPPSVHPPAGEPRAFTYGHFPLYMLAGAAQFLSGLFAPVGGGQWADYDHIQLVGRALSGLWDTLTILLIYLLGKELFGKKRAGLLAAAFQAFAVLHIQLSHFAAFDAIMATFVTMALLFAVRGVKRGGAGNFALAGIAAGLAIGSLARALPILLPIGLAPLARLWIENGSFLKADAWDERQRRRAYGLIALAALAIALAALAFAVTNPFALLDSQSFLQNLNEQSRMVRGDVDFPFTRQYRFTPAFLYQIEQQLRWGLGWPLGLAGFLGVAWALARLARRRASAGELIVLAWFVPYFVINGAFMVKFMRYMVILTPFLCLYAGQALWALADALRRLPSLAPAAEPATQRTEAREGRAGALRWADTLRRRIRGALAGVDWPRVGRWAGPALIAAALVWTILYALAFTSIYSRPHTWVQASRWMYANIPNGATIAVEHWDDELPKSLREPNANPGAHGFRHVTLPLYEEDNANKYQIIKDALQKSDYLVLATNRLYRSIPRLTRRYPMTIRYYDLLFSGELGFELVASFTSYPQIGPLVWNDDASDESFTVYDHPKPLIFKKVRQLSDQELFSKLGDTWTSAVAGWVGDKRAAGAPAAVQQPRKSLMLGRPVDQLPVVSDYRWNVLASGSAPLAALLWWLALTVIGLAAAPLAFVVLGRLRDRGWALTKALGLLVVGYLNWIGASLHVTQNRTLVIAGCLLVVAGASTLLFARRREEMLAFLRKEWRLILFIEGLFAIAYAGFVVLRLYNPDLWQPWTGGEKSMEFAFLNAVLKSAYFVPYDPYFAGGTLNYYYYGQYLVSLLIKLTGIEPSVAFNLAIPALFAMTVTGAFGVAYTLAGRYGRRAAATRWTQGLTGGLLAGAFVALMGNLESLIQIVRSIGNVGGSQFQSNIPNLTAIVRLAAGVIKIAGGRASLPPFDYWDPSRVIPATINEFPLWSFSFADLHPHMIAIPFAILALGLALNLVLRPAVPSQKGYPYAIATLAPYVPDAGEALAWLILPLSVGALGAINTWDLPTYLGLTILAYALRVGRAGERRLGLAKTALFAGFLGAGSLLLYLPFYRSYAAMSVGIGVVRERTDVWLWLIVWLTFLFMALSFYLIELQRPGERPALLRIVRLYLSRWEEAPRLGVLHAALVSATGAYRRGRLALLLALVAIALFAALGYGVIALTLLVLLCAALLFLRQAAAPEDAFVNLLWFTGFLVLCGVEVVFLKDFLQGGEHYRMNTLFKFYIQVWVMLGIAAGATLPRLWEAVEAWRSPAWRWAWQLTLAALLGASFLFIALGLPARVADRFPGQRPALGTLDGMAYMTVGSYTWPDPSYRIELSYDYDAIRWLLDNVRGTPVIAEAAISYYREGGLRVSSYTGLPTLVGMHQNEQRYGDIVSRREDQARTLFDTTDQNVALDLIGQLDISLIYVGQLERAPKLYAPAGITKFEQMAQAGALQVVYRNPRVVIYAVPGKWSLSSP